MKRLFLTVTLTIASLAAVIAVAQDTAEPSSATGEESSNQGMMQPMVPGMMDQGRGMMGMMQMMMQCASMMEGKQGDTAGNMGMRGSGMMNGAGTGGMMGMMGGQMGEAQSVRYDQAAAEAVARAFLAGRTLDAGTEVEILQVELSNGSYTVSYRSGDTKGAVIVDAATGEAKLTPEGQ